MEVDPESIDEESQSACCDASLKLLQTPCTDEETNLHSNDQHFESIQHLEIPNNRQNGTHLQANSDDTDSITETIVTIGQPLCRICLELGSEELFTPCKCDGSSRYVHESCLLKWFHKTRRKRCEICLSKVNIKSTGCKPIRKWRIPKGTYNFVFYFYVIYALATFCTSSIAFSVAITERCITPTCIALYIACILSTLSLIYCAGFTIYIKLFWKAAITTNKNWKVYDRVSFKRTERQTSRESREASDGEGGLVADASKMLCRASQSDEMSSSASNDCSVNNNEIVEQNERR